MKHQAFVLTILMLSSSLFGLFINATGILEEADGGGSQPDELGPEAIRDFASLNSSEIVSISTIPTTLSNSFKVQVEEGKAVRNISLEMQPKALPRDEAVSFTQPNDFNQTGAISEGIDFNNSGLQVSAIDEYWDFEGSNNLPTGWTSTNSYYGRINTMTCGTNGTSSRSLTVRHNSVSVTSNQIDLSSLSTGQISFWMREGQSGCGEDPDSSEHMYVEYLRSSGSWGQITYFNAGLGYPYYTPRSVSFSLPNDAFHSNFKFRFRLSHGSGTCCDWWFVDDVRLTKPGGVGSLSTPAFGPNASLASFRSLPGPYGVMSIDTDAPANAVSWSVLDASNGSVLDGFWERSERWADLGGIDWKRHPAIRLKVTLSAQGTGTVSKINGVHIQGRFVNSFDDNPNDWNLVACTWDGDSITGDGEAYSPTIISRRPISRIESDAVATGSGSLQIALDGAGWADITNSGLTVLERPAHEIKFRWYGGGQTFDLQKFDVNLHSSGLPESPRIDLWGDGVDEWGVVNQSIGTWGAQDRLADGNLSRAVKFPGQHNIPLWIPRDTSGDLIFEISPDNSSGVSALMVQLIVDGTLVASWNHGSASDSRILRLQGNDKTNFMTEVALSQPVWSQHGVEYVAAELVLDAQAGGATLSGLLLPHSPVANLHFEPSDPLTLRLNDMAKSMTANSGWVTLPLSMIWNYPASMEVTLTALNSGDSAAIVLEQASNLSATLTPSWRMVEITNNISFSNGQLAALRYELTGLRNSLVYTVWVGANPLPNDSLVGDADAIILPETFAVGPYSPPANASGPGVCCELHPTLSFSPNATWDDEEMVTLSVRGVMVDGLISLPWVQRFGVGPSQGVENDIKVSEWRVLNDRGIVIPEHTSYLKSDSDITIEVELGFENIESLFGPRAGEAEVRLYENGILKSTTTHLERGVATFVTRTPAVTGVVSYSVEFSPLVGGDDVTTVALQRVFEIDGLPPQVVSKNIADHDHLEPSSAQQFIFEISDQPTLPTDITLMLWRQWQDDADGDAEADAGEYQPQSLDLPANLSGASGNYTFTFDDTFGLEGDIVAAYIIGSDAAGNMIEGGGGAEAGQTLFMYQLMSDEAPSINRQGAGWDGGVREWLHPSVVYGLTLPFTEENGFSDVEGVTLNLAGNSENDILNVRWNSTSESCLSSSFDLQIISCEVSAQQGNLSAFTSDLQIHLEFVLSWDLPREDGLRREPDLEVVDRAGQGAWIAYPELRWRYSTDMEIVTESVQVSLDEGSRSSDGAWVRPNSNITISGRVAFSPSGDTPQDEIKVKVLLDGRGQSVRTEDGDWQVTLKAPNNAPETPIPLTYELTDLPAMARDVTDEGMSSLLITVDATAPIPVAVVGPREGSIIPISSLSSVVVELQIDEREQLDGESLSLHWLVTHGSSPYGDEIASGNSSMHLPSHNAAGEAIPVRATFNLAGAIPAQYLPNELAVHVWVAGSDMVGHQMVSDIQFNSPNKPLAMWTLQRLEAKLVVDRNNLSYSHYSDLVSGQSVTVTVAVENLGQVHGTAEITLIQVGAQGEEVVVTPVARQVGVDPRSSSIVQIDWLLKSSGHFHIKVLMDGEEVAIGETISVDEAKAEGLLGDLQQRGFTLEWLVILGGLFIMLTAIIVIAIRAGGPIDEDEWADDVDATASLEAEMNGGGDSAAIAASEWATMQAQSSDLGQPTEWTPEQIAWWQGQQSAQSGSSWTPEQIDEWRRQQGQQTEWTPEQIAYWQAQQAEWSAEQVATWQAQQAQQYGDSSQEGYGWQ